MAEMNSTFAATAFTVIPNAIDYGQSIELGESVVPIKRIINVLHIGPTGNSSDTPY